MESSSDESFAWTNASSNSDDSDCVESTSIMFDNKEICSKEVDVTSNKVSEKSFPEEKAKGKKIVTKTPDSKNSKDSPKNKKMKEEPTEDNCVSKKKRKKHKNESNETLENSQQYIAHDDEYLNIKVKQEKENFDASTNTKTKKSKRRHTENNSGYESFIELDTTKIESSSEKDEKKIKNKKYKDLELDSVVYEKKLVKSPKKSRNKSNEDIYTGKSNDSNFIIEDDTFSVTELVVHKKRKQFKHNTNDESYNEKITDSTESINNEQNTITNKKKKKSANNKSIKKDVSSDDNQIIEDKFSAEETVVQRKSKHSKPTSYTNSEINSKEDANSLFSMGKSKLLNVDNSSNRGNIGTSNYSETYNGNSDSEKIMNESIAEVSPHNKSMSSRNKKKSPVQETPKIMDRLTFEEEIDSEADSSQNDTNKHSLQFNKFLKKNTNLQPVLQNLENFAELTQNDEIWLIKCPQEVYITSFYNKDLIVDHKSKIKINGETYNGTLDEEIDKVTVLSTDKSEYMIKDVKVNGIITFRKRLRKPHVQEDKVMSNNQPDFIPLPETKCRHPLFGSNYQNSIKIPTSVAHRSNSFSTDTSTEPNERKTKKKYKKEHNKDKEMDVTLAVKEPKVEVADDVLRKKAKKRKHINDDDISVKKAKRIKQEHDSSEVWESEKAIEENLFNF